MKKYILGHVLHPVDVMQSQGYQLTANALKDSIQDAYKKVELDGIIPMKNRTLDSVPQYIF